MKRREFSAAAAGAVAASAFANPAFAQAAAPQEGKQYRKLSTPAMTDAPAGKVEVVEFFWYNCNHCNSFEPQLEAWLKTAPKNSVFRRVPIAFNPSFADQQKLYYALEGMGKVEEIHPRVFRAIHVEKQNLSKEAAIFDWMGKNLPSLGARKIFFNAISAQYLDARELRNMHPRYEDISRNMVFEIIETASSEEGLAQKVRQLRKELAAFIAIDDQRQLIVF